jgi:hypothetical protein
MSLCYSILCFYLALSGYLAKFEKIENIIPVLVSCFEESMSLFSTTPDATGQSYKILSSVLRCLYSASEVLVQNSNMLKQHLVGSILVHFRKILEEFPLGPKNYLTNKVYPSSLSLSPTHTLKKNTFQYLKLDHVML